MGVWRHRDDGQVECLRHGAVFPSAHECAACVADPPPVEGESAPPELTNDLAGHEAAFERTARRADRLAAEVASGKRTVNERTEPLAIVAKLLDVAIKARRAAAELCEKREAQQRIEGLERALRKFHAAEARQGAH